MIRLQKIVLNNKRFYTRWPILGVLGHVDHGKTTLVDFLRNTDVASQEAGGITQRNSIFQHTLIKNNLKFTIVDTPGHAAFSRMRSTGSALADVAILVVDCTEGVKYQTVECIKLLKDSNVPMVVALNKADLPKANYDKCYEMLFEEGVETVQIGGNVPAVPISALHGTNVSQLMDAVKSITNQLNLYADVNNGFMEGIIFDIKKQKQNKIVITALVRKGVVQKGDTIITDTHTCSVRELLSLNGEKLKVAKPGTPVLIVGPQSHSKFLSTGCTIYSVPAAKTIADQKANSYLISSLKNKVNQNIEKEQLPEQLGYGIKKVSFILCADGNSSLEILHQMLDIDTEGLKISIFSSTVKVLTPEQIKIAEAINAQIVLFNVPALKVETTAVVHHFDIIHELASSINLTLSNLLPQYSNIKKTDLGNWVVEEIHGTKKKQIAGLRKRNGTLAMNEHFSLLRNGLEIWNGKIRTINYFKSRIIETKDGMSECGVGFPPSTVEIKTSDVLQCYKEEEIITQFIGSEFFGLSPAEHSVKHDKSYSDAV